MKVTLDTTPDQDAALAVLVQGINAQKPDPAAPDLTVDDHLQQLLTTALKQAVQTAPLQTDLDAVVAVWTQLTPDQRATINRTVRDAR